MIAIVLNSAGLIVKFASVNLCFGDIITGNALRLFFLLGLVAGELGFDPRPLGVAKIKHFI